MFQSVVNDIDDSSFCSSVQPLTVANSQKQMTVMSKSTDSVEKQKAKIVWTLNCVACDWSASSANHISNLIKTMFLDSQVASEFEMSHNKLTSLINFGIALYFGQILVEEINCCSFLTMSFDENLNKVMQANQMDLVIRYHHLAYHQVSECY